MSETHPYPAGAAGHGIAPEETRAPMLPPAPAVTLGEPPPEAIVTDDRPAPTPEPIGEGGARIDDLLRHVVDIKASDLHVKPGAPPTVRISGLLEPLPHPPMKPQQCHEMVTAMIGDKERDELDNEGEVDFAYSLPGVGRFRVNAHRQRGSLAIAARRILPHAPEFRDLSLPKAIEHLANEHRGLLLVTGPTSSGKTATCGAIIKHINQTRRCHIVTIEDPIEILHHDELAVITQREVGQDTMTFHKALRAALRQDPDVIFVGEIRDIETVSAALQAAETGHLVVATMHTTDVAETVNRIVDFFPSHQQKQVRVALAGSLAGVITQRLLPKIGGGRAPAIEILIMNGRIRDCVLDPDKTHEISTSSNNRSSTACKPSTKRSSNSSRPAW
ncbi:MAG: type IV pilus twitching motility protein PilT [Actinomycetota bacterium]